MIWEEYAKASSGGSRPSGPHSGRTLVEDCLTLDLARLMRLGPIRAGLAGDGQMEWSIEGQGIGSIQFRIDLRRPEAAQLILAYVLKVEGESRVVAQRIRLAFTVPEFGGMRWWMLCPETGKRVRCLHLSPAGDRFASREALGLVYRVERLAHADRPFEKLFRQQGRLGGKRGWSTVPARPKGMWRRTYERHLARLAVLDADCCTVLLA